EMMDRFGRMNAGAEVTAAQFQAHAERAAGKSLKEFFTYWLTQTGLPDIILTRARVLPAADGKTFTVEVEVQQSAGPDRTLPVTIESSDGEHSDVIALDKGKGHKRITVVSKPKRVVLDKYGQAARGNGGPFTITTFYQELDRTL